MSILTTNPARVTIQLLDNQGLTQEQIFRLAHSIDAYEIERKMEENLVIDIQEISKSGKIVLVIVPKGGLTYDDLSYHLDMIMSFALKSVNLEKCRWELSNIYFQIQNLGKPSYVADDAFYSEFKQE